MSNNAAKAQERISFPAPKQARFPLTTGENRAFRNEYNGLDGTEQLVRSLVEANGGYS